MIEEVEEFREDLLRSQTKINFTSYSRLAVYMNCSWQYKLRYLDKVPFPKIVNEALALGTLSHSVLEEVLDPGTAIDDALEAMTLHLPGWIEKLGLEEPDSYLDCVELASGLADLLYRCSERCRRDPIRNKDGSLPKDPINFPPGLFTEALRESGLSEERTNLDNWAAAANPVFTGISLSWLLGRAAYMTKYFTVPDWVKQTLHVELAFSTTEADGVHLPRSRSEDAFFHGKIDWVVETTSNEIAILDHKSGKECPDPQAVLHSPQLNLYAYAYRELYGTWPDLIAINHLPSSNIVMAAVDRDIALSTASYYRQLQEASETPLWVRRSPTEYKTPCIRRDWKTKRVVETCPYLNQCWPFYVETLIL